jgi:cephalosporin hydroxylase
MIVTRDEFEIERIQAAKRMIEDPEICEISTTLIEKGVKHKLAYQTNWMGEPILQYPQDLFAIQEVIYQSRPEYVIEVGVAWAGSLLFYNDILRSTGGKGVVGIDVFIPDDLRQRVSAKDHGNPGIHLIEGGSTCESTFEEIARLTHNSGKLLIHLDSNHTHEHVLVELHMYSQLLNKGMYIICGDTHVENLPSGTYGDKAYDKGNNPMTALRDFLESPAGKHFSIDPLVSGKYLLSLNPKGYLVRL